MSLRAPRFRDRLALSRWFAKRKQRSVAQEAPKHPVEKAAALQLRQRRLQQAPAGVENAAAWFKGDESRLVFGIAADAYLARGGADLLTTAGLRADSIEVGGTGTDGPSTATLKINAATDPWTAKLHLGTGAHGNQVAGVTAYGATGEVRIGGIATNYFPTPVQSSAEHL